jgi:hypothetical protein
MKVAATVTGEKNQPDQRLMTRISKWLKTMGLKRFTFVPSAQIRMRPTGIAIDLRIK